MRYQNWWWKYHHNQFFIRAGGDSWIQTPKFPTLILITLCLVPHYPTSPIWHTRPHYCVAYPYWLCVLGDQQEQYMDFAVSQQSNNICCTPKPCSQKCNSGNLSHRFGFKLDAFSPYWHLFSQPIRQFVARPDSKSMYNPHTYLHVRCHHTAKRRLKTECVQLWMEIWK
jgi:hypothetical protein